MSTPEATPAAAPPAVAATPVAPKKSGMLGKLLGLVFILGVAGGETTVGYMMVPHLADAAVTEEGEAGEEGEMAEAEHAAPAAEAGGHGDAHGGGHGGGHGDEGPALPSDPDALVEIELGEFRVEAFQPLSNLTKYLDFQLIGTVRAGDHAEFTALAKANQHRLRDQIIAVMRNSEADDLADPGLGLIKRRVLKKSNDLLGKPLLTSIVVSRFSYHEN